MSTQRKDGTFTDIEPIQEAVQTLNKEIEADNAKQFVTDETYDALNNKLKALDAELTGKD